MKKPRPEKGPERPPLDAALRDLQKLCWHMQALAERLATERYTRLNAKELTSYERAKEKREERKRVRREVFEARKRGLTWRQIYESIPEINSHQRAAQLYVEAEAMHKAGWLYPKPIEL